MKRLSITKPLLRRAALPIFVLLLTACTTPAKAQTADSLSQVKKIYIDASGARPAAAEMRRHLIDNLRKDPALEIVADQSRADAILKATSEIWVKAYLSANPRSPGNKYPVYGGFLSAQLDGKDGDALWSYLVTPSTYASNGIRQDLADQFTKKLLAALLDAASSSPASPRVQSTTHLLKIA